MNIVWRVISWGANFCYFHVSFASHENFHPRKLMPVQLYMCGRWTDRGRGQNTVAAQLFQVMNSLFVATVI